MTTGPVLLGLDLGTSGCKLLAFDAQGTVLARASRLYPLRNPRPGFFELDADVVWAAAVACLREIGRLPLAKAIRPCRFPCKARRSRPWARTDAAWRRRR